MHDAARFRLRREQRKPPRQLAGVVFVWYFKESSAASARAELRLAVILDGKQTHRCARRRGKADDHGGQRLLAGRLDDPAPPEQKAEKDKDEV